MLEVFPTHLPVHSFRPVRPSLGPLTDCFVLLRHGVTATLGEMAQNASSLVQWVLRLPKDPRVSALLSFPCSWHPCSLAELRWDISAGKRRKTQHLHFNSSLVRFCCHIVLLPLPCIFQQNETSYHQPVEVQEGRSFTHMRWKEQDFLCFRVGCREKTSPNSLLPHLLLKVFWHGRKHHRNNRCWRCLPDATGCVSTRLFYKCIQISHLGPGRGHWANQ